MTAKKSNPIPDGASAMRPKAPASPPMLPSTEREYREKIKQLQQEKETIGSVILFEITRIVNESEYITEEQKTKLLAELWKNRKESHK